MPTTFRPRTFLVAYGAQQLRDEVHGDGGHRTCRDTLDRISGSKGAGSPPTSPSTPSPPWFDPQFHSTSPSSRWPSRRYEPWPLDDCATCQLAIASIASDSEIDTESTSEAAGRRRYTTSELTGQIHWTVDPIYLPVWQVPEAWNRLATLQDIHST